MTAPTVASGTMPLAEHAREAKRRSARAAVALVIGVVAGFVLADQIIDVLRTPIEDVARSRAASLNYDTVTGAFDLKLRIALVTGVVVSSPVWLFELFGFLTPGLTRRERKYVVGFAGAAIPLFLGGCAFGYALFPHMVQVLTAFSSDEDSTILNAAYYVDFVMKIVLAIGIAFVLPVVVVMLNFLGLLPAATLRRSWRVVVVVITLFSALVTPAADVMSMFFVAAPMTALFGIALGITHLRDRPATSRTTPPSSEEPSCSD